MEADRELLAYLTVVVGHDVAGIRVDSDEIDDLDVDSGFLANFTDDRIGDALAGFMATAGQCPKVVVGLVDEKELARVIADDGRDGGNDGIHLGGIWIVEVVPATHRATVAEVVRERGRADSHTRSKLST